MAIKCLLSNILPNPVGSLVVFKMETGGPSKPGRAGIKLVGIQCRLAPECSKDIASFVENSYVDSMKNNYELIVPNDYPELKSLFWNSSPARAIKPQDALSLYERYWRFIDQNALTEREVNLIDHLKSEYGHGYLMA